MKRKPFVACVSFSECIHKPLALQRHCMRISCIKYSYFKQLLVSEIPVLRGLSSTLMQGRKNRQEIHIFLLFAFLFFWSFPCLGSPLSWLPFTTRSSTDYMEQIINSLIAQKHRVFGAARHVLHRYSLHLYRSAKHWICACDW